MKKEFKEYDEETLQKIQQTEMEILKDFIEVCEKHNLTYFGIAGTGIGALRHQGFIPWDDDIDVAMPRDDFERLVRFIEKEKGDKYLIMDTKHYPNYPLMTTRITMRGTKFKEEALKSIDAPMGIFLDLYPLDKMSDDPKEAKKQALENIDLMKYKLERQLRKFNNMIKSKKLLKAKELEEMDDEYNPNL